MVEIGWTLGIAMYGLIWFAVLFAVLPFGVRSQAESGKAVRGTDLGAPVQAHMKRKLLATSLLAGVIFIVLYVGLTSSRVAMWVMG